MYVWSAQYGFRRLGGCFGATTCSGLTKGNGYRSITAIYFSTTVSRLLVHRIMIFIQIILLKGIVIINNVSYDATCGACYCPFLCLIFYPFLFGMHQWAMKRKKKQQQLQQPKKSPITPKTTTNERIKSKNKKKMRIKLITRRRNDFRVFLVVEIWSEAYQRKRAHVYERFKVNNQCLFILLFYPKQLQFRFGFYGFLFA